MTPNEGISTLLLLVTRIEKAAMLTIDATTKFGLVEAHHRSQGGLSISDLVKMDHPFAVRHGGPLADPSVLNKHTGAFDAHWVSLRPWFGAGEVRNESPIAGYLVGDNRPKSTMFRRPIDDALEMSMYDFAEKDILDRIQSVFNL